MGISIKEIFIGSVRGRSCHICYDLLTANPHDTLAFTQVLRYQLKKPRFS